MGLTNQEKINLNSKVLAAKVIDNNQSAQWYESKFPYSPNTVSQRIPIEYAAILANPAANQTEAQANVAGPLADIVIDYTLTNQARRLTTVAGANGTTWVAKETYGDFSSPTITDWLQPQAIPKTNGDPSAGYSIRLYNGDPDNGGTEILTTEGQTGSGPNASVGWIWNYDLGLLFLSEDFKNTYSEFWVKGFVYDGDYLSDTEITGITKTIVQDGLNTYVTGDATEPSVNVSAATLDNLTVTGNTVVDNLTATGSTTLDGVTVPTGAIVSGSTDLYNIFLTEGEVENTTVSAGDNIDVTPSGSDYEVALQDDIDLNSVTANNVTATTLNGGTIFSGTTDLGEIFLTDVSGGEGIEVVDTTINVDLFDGSEVVTPNTVTTSQGNADVATVGSNNIVISDSDAVSISTSSPITVGTRLQIIDNTFSLWRFTVDTDNSTADELDYIVSNITKDGSSSDFTTGGFASRTNVAAGSVGLANVTGVAGISFLEFDNDKLKVSVLDEDDMSSDSDTHVPTQQSVKAYVDNSTADISNKYDKTGGTISGSVFITGNLDVFGTATTLNTEIVRSEDNNIELNYGGNHSSSYGGGITVMSGISNFADSTLTIDGLGKWSANTEFIAGDGLTVESGAMVSGSTDLYDIFSTEDTIDITRVQDGLNTYTGGTANEPTINISAATLDNLTVTGDTNVGNLTATGSTTLDGVSVPTGAIISGTTDLYDIFATEDTIDVVRVQGGINTYTGGTANEPTINVSAATLDNLTVTGSTTLDGVSVPTGAIISGTTDLYDIFLESSDIVESPFSGNSSNGAIVSIENNPGNVSDGNFSFVVGQNNSAEFTNATIVGGQSNTNNDPNAIIAGGVNNTIDQNGPASMAGIFGGVDNEVQGGSSVILGGYGNTISGNSSTQSAAIASDQGYMYNSSRSVIMGVSSTIDHSNYSFAGGIEPTIIGDNGVNNTAFVYGNQLTSSASTQSALLAGSGNTLIGADYSVIIGGQAITGTSSNTVYTPNLDVQDVMMSAGTDLYDIFAEAGDVNTFDNGLTEVGGVVDLGGTITEDTIFTPDTTATYNLQFGQGTASSFNSILNTAHNSIQSQIYNPAGTYRVDFTPEGIVSQSDVRSSFELATGVTVSNSNTGAIFPGGFLLSAERNGSGTGPFGASGTTEITTDYAGGLEITSTLKNPDGSNSVERRIGGLGPGNKDWQITNNHDTGGNTNKSILFGQVVGLLGTSEAENGFTAGFGASALDNNPGGYINLSNGGDQKSLSTPVSEKGIRAFDSMDETGLFYAGDYSVSGVSEHGDRWIPDLGYVQDLVSNGEAKVQGGQNIFTGGSANAPTINLVDSPSVEDFAFSGTATGGDLNADNIVSTTLYSTDLSGGTIYSGDTDINEYFTDLASDISDLESDISDLQTDKYDKTGGTISGSVFITGNLDVFGTATTLNTEIVRSEDNNIELNYGGNHSSAYGGGITVMSGISNFADSTLTIDGLGKWSANTEFIAGDGLTVESGAMVSGSTDLYDIFAQQADAEIVTASNGLEKVGSNIVLGGPLTGNTNIYDTTNSYTFDLGGQIGQELGAINLGAKEIDLFSFSGDGSASASLNLNTDGTANLGTVGELEINAVGGAIFRNFDDNGGLRYADDYSANYTDRSLVDKAFVTGLTSNIETVTASNGLEKVGTNIVLGGPLTGDTTIELGSDTLKITGASNSSMLLGSTAGTTLGMNIDGFFLGSPSLREGVFSDYSNSVTTIFNNTSLQIDNQGFTFNHPVADSAPRIITSASTGLEYDADYSVSGTTVIGDRWIPDWAAVKSYSDFNVRRIESGTSATADTRNDLISVDVNTAFTVYLPDNPSTGDKFVIKDSSGDAVTNNITVAVQGNAYSIDGSTQEILVENYESATYVFDGVMYLNL